MFFEIVTFYLFQVPTEEGIVFYETADSQEIQDYLKEGLGYEVHSTIVLARWFQVWLFFAIMVCLIYGIFIFGLLSLG